MKRLQCQVISCLSEFIQLGHCGAWVSACNFLIPGSSLMWTDKHSVWWDGNFLWGGHSTTCNASVFWSQMQTNLSRSVPLQLPMASPSLHTLVPLLRTTFPLHALAKSNSFFENSMFICFILHKYFPRTRPSLSSTSSMNLMSFLCVLCTTLCPHGTWPVICVFFLPRLLLLLR